MSKKITLLLSIMMVLSMILSACGGTATTEAPGRGPPFSSKTLPPILEVVEPCPNAA